MFCLHERKEQRRAPCSQIAAALVFSRRESGFCQFPISVKQKTSDVVTKNPSKEHEKHESGTSHTFYKLEEHPIEEKYTSSKHTGHAITSAERCCC